MQTIGTFEVKTHLSKLLDKVCQGMEFTITRHGVPIAKLVPFSRNRKKNVIDTIEKMEAFQMKHTLGGLSIKEMIEEGRK
jgi:prevent-host-death family protein